MSTDPTHQPFDHTDFEVCYAAVASRDRRFDGRFITGVLTTGIYCRPSCPARTPNRPNVRFFPSPAAAQQEGLRACRRCRPELAPDAPGTDPTSEIAARALQLIDAGVGDDGVESLASAVHLSPRQLQRVLTTTYGAGPAALSRARRVRLARLLVDQTDLPLARVAHAAGFSSVRQFNHSFREAFQTTPSSVRRACAPLTDAGPPRTTIGHATEASGSGSGHQDTLTLTLPVRTPFDGTAVLSWAALHAVPSRDEVGDGRWVRHTDLGTVTMRPVTEGLEISTILPADGPLDLRPTVALARHAFDTDADVHAVQQALGADRLLGPILRRRPGTRIPGTAHPFEGAVRVVLGQQVSAKGATTLMARLADLTDAPGLPPAEEIAGLPLESLIGIPGQRAGAVRALAAAHADGLDLSPSADVGATVTALLDLKGIGPWTAHSIALVVLRHPDAWPTGDLALQRAVEGLTGTRPSTPELDAMADRWRPWRGYAAMLLWHHHLDTPAPPARPVHTPPPDHARGPSPDPTSRPEDDR